MTFDGSDRLTTSPLSISSKLITSPPSEASTFPQSQEVATHPSTPTSSTLPLRPIVTTALPVYIHHDPSSPTTATTDAVMSPGTAGTQRTLFEEDQEVMCTDHSKIGNGNQVPRQLSHPSETKEQYSFDHDHTPPHTTLTPSSSTLSPFMHLQGQPRHPPNVQNSLYTRFFRLETDQARSEVIVRSSWLSTGWLLGVRSLLFLYTSVVLITDMFRNDRPQFAFCYLTQLSYFGLISYLGVSFLCLLSLLGSPLSHSVSNWVFYFSLGVIAQLRKTAGRSKMAAWLFEAHHPSSYLFFLCLGATQRAFIFLVRTSGVRRSRGLVSSVKVNKGWWTSIEGGGRQTSYCPTCINLQRSFFSSFLFVCAPEGTLSGCVHVLRHGPLFSPNEENFGSALCFLRYEPAILSSFPHELPTLLACFLTPSPSYRMAKQKTDNSATREKNVLLTYRPLSWIARKKKKKRVISFPLRLRSAGASAQWAAQLDSLLSTLFDN